MKRLAILTAGAVLSVLALAPVAATASPNNTPAPAPTQNPTLVPTQPPVLVWHHKPVFNNYLECFNGWVYVDFKDVDGNEALMSVMMGVKRNGVWTNHAMHNSGPSAHGVFFYKKLSDSNINPATVQQYRFRATDEDGLVSSYVYADSDCNVQ